MSWEGPGWLGTALRPHVPWLLLLRGKSFPQADESQAVQVWALNDTLASHLAPNPAPCTHGFTPPSLFCRKGVDPSLTDTSERVAQLSGDALTKLLNAREEAFDRRFEYVFLGAPRPSPAPHPPGEEGGNEARVGSVGGVGQGREASDDLSDESNASVGAGSDGEQGGQEGAGASSGGGGSSSDSSSSSGDSGVDARDEGSGGSSRDGAPSGTSGAGAGEGASTGARAAGAGAGGAGLAGAGGRTLRPSWYQVSGADADTIEVAKTALSNLLGSLGYWHGTVQVRGV